MTDTRVIIAGDSEALGFQNTGPAPYTPTIRVQIWAKQPDGSYAWNYMRPGVNTGTEHNPTAWGAEVGLANKWLAANPDGFLWIVKDDETVKGGTKLAVEWNPDHGAMFSSTTHAAFTAMHNLDGTAFAFDHYDTALVALGTNDAADPVAAAHMLENLTAFVPAARDAWDVNEIVMPRIADHVGTAADNLTVRQAQYTADQASPYLETFKTIGFGLQSDLIHYDASGQLAVGAAFYDAWLTA